METSNTEQIILLDCDVISHFIANNCLDDLPKILSPRKCVVLENVYIEVSRNYVRVAFLDKLIKAKVIFKQHFPEEIEAKKEFARIKNIYPLIGDGERACMAVAKCNKNIVASSNFRDIAPYCNNNNIHYLGTLDILVLAVNRDIYNESQCNTFITTALASNRAKFPKGVTEIKFYPAPDLSWF